LPNIEEFVPVARENIDTIRARMDSDINAGLSPSDPRWVDVVEGGPYWDLSQVVALEVERLWDFLSVEVAAAMFPSFAWGQYLDEHALTFGLVRKDAVKASGIVRFTGDDGTAIISGTQVGTEPDDPDDDPIVFETTASGTIPIAGVGYVDLPVQALESGSDSNVAIGIASLLFSGVAGVASVSNITAIIGGEDQESDVALQDRVLLEISSAQGAGTASDYTRWALSYPGVGHVTVQPAWAGGGTVRVVVTDADNQPVGASTVTGLQAVLDPTSAPGAGQGLAPIGAIVTVATPAFYYVNVVATVVHETGYSLDGTSGTIATRALITAAITAYVNQLAPGAEVVTNRVEYAILSVKGVHDVSGTQLAGFLTQANAIAGTPTDRALSATNLPVATGKVARVQTVTLS
jgi:uncharacterized phage protein gp47/JayE